MLKTIENLRTEMKKYLAIALISVFVFPLEARAWIVQCKPGTTCQPSCKNAGGKLLTHPTNGTKWCSIPSSVKANTPSILNELREAGLDTENVIEKFPVSEPSGTSPVRQQVKKSRSNIKNNN
jgi:hypothetical protein